MYLPADVAEHLPLSHRYQKGHMRGTAVLWALAFVFEGQTSTAIPPWLLDTASSVAARIVLTQVNDGLDAAFRGLAHCVKAESFATAFSYIQLANFVMDGGKKSHFSGMTGSEFERRLRIILPSVDSTKLDVPGTSWDPIFVRSLLFVAFRWRNRIYQMISTCFRWSLGGEAGTARAET